MSKPKLGDWVRVSNHHEFEGRVGLVVSPGRHQFDDEVTVELGDDGMIRYFRPCNLELLNLYTTDPTTKATNPKDAIGSDKLPLHLWPETATVMGTLGMLDGMLKYGRANWRVAGVRATIYIDAVKRHVNAYAEGEDLDPDSGVPHLAHALACLAILVDAGAADMLTDDRQYPGGYRSLVEELTPHVPRLKAKHVGKNPKHYTIADKPVGTTFISRSSQEFSGG